MEKIIMIIEKSKDHFGAYAENCEGIYAAGDSIEAVKMDTIEAIRLLKETKPEEQWPYLLKAKHAMRQTARQ